MRTLIFITMIFSINLEAQTITNNDQLSCTVRNRCIVNPSEQKIKSTFVQFSEKKMNGKKSIFSVRIIPPRGRASITTIPSMDPVQSDDPYEFRYVDLNGDSHKDLALKVSTGTNINKYQYWYFSRKKGKYISLGIHEEVYYNKKTKKLHSMRRKSSEKTRQFELIKEDIRPIDQ